MVVDDRYFVGPGWEDWDEYMIRLVSFVPCEPGSFCSPPSGSDVELEVWESILEDEVPTDYYREVVDGPEYDKALDMWCEKNVTCQGKLVDDIIAKREYQHEI